MAEQPHSWLQNLGLAIEVLCPALALIVVMLRVYIRLKKQNYGWDDTLIIVALMLSIVLSIGTSFVIKLDYVGIHIWDIPKEYDMTKPLIWIYVTGVVYNPILAVVKQSVLVFLVRLGSAKPGVTIAAWAISVFNVAEMIAVFLVVIFQCKPIRANWEPSLITEGKATCINQRVFGALTAGLTILTDLVVLALPVYIFFDLKIGKRTKIALLGVFLLGFVVTVVSVLRMYYFNIRVISPKDKDPTFSIAITLSAIEGNLAILTACGPALWPLLRSWMPRLFSNLGISNGYQRRSDGPSRGASPWTLRGSNSSKKTRSGATHTVGGSYALESFQEARGDRAKGRTEIRAAKVEDSDEEALTQTKGAGITRTIQYSVERDDESSL